MVDTPTTTYGLLKPQVGASSDTWGTTINADLDAIDSIVAGVAASVTSLSNSTSPFLVPTGAILLWSGSVASIPSGWLLCDGTSGTPNLRDRFVVGAGSTYAVGDTGGESTVTLAEANIPEHAHTFSATTSSDGSHTHNIKVGDGYQGSGAYLDLGGESAGYYSSAYAQEAGDHTHTVSGTTSSIGSGTAHENRPPYYALAYIMKS